MENTKQQIIDKFFTYYKDRDMQGIKQVMSENVLWIFLGQHPLAGVKKGIDEVIDFFDSMSEIMAKSNGKTEKLITSENADYYIECQHSSTNRADGFNLDHYSCVLWTFKNGKIIEGRHFFAAPQAVNNYFSAVAKRINT